MNISVLKKNNSLSNTCCSIDIDYDDHHLRILHPNDLKKMQVPLRGKAIKSYDIKMEIQLTEEL
jgi:hypothetical protein